MSRDHYKSLPYSVLRSFNLSSVNVRGNCTEQQHHQLVTITNNTAVFTSPNWPHHYKPDVSALLNVCGWRVDVPVNTRVRVYYMYLNLAASVDDESTTCTGGDASRDRLVLTGYTRGQAVLTEYLCGHSYSFTRYFDMPFDRLMFQLKMKTTPSARRNNTGGFVIGIVFIPTRSEYDAIGLLVYWWVIPIVLLLSAVLLNCLRKKVNSQNNREKRNERAFTNSLSGFSDPISMPHHPSITQNTSNTVLEGIQNYGQVLDEPQKQQM